MEEAIAIYNKTIENFEYMVGHRANISDRMDLWWRIVDELAKTPDEYKAMMEAFPN